MYSYVTARFHSTAQLIGCLICNKTKGSCLTNTHSYKWSQNHKHGPNKSVCVHTLAVPHGFIGQTERRHESGNHQSSLITTQTASGDSFSSPLLCDITTLIITFPFDAVRHTLVDVLGAIIVFFNLPHLFLRNYFFTGIRAVE